MRDLERRLAELEDRIVRDDRGALVFLPHNGRDAGPQRTDARVALYWGPSPAPAGSILLDWGGPPPPTAAAVAGSAAERYEAQPVEAPVGPPAESVAELPPPPVEAPPPAAEATKPWPRFAASGPRAEGLELLRVLERATRV